jgi:ribonuclease P protein component
LTATPNPKTARNTLPRKKILRGRDLFLRLKAEGRRKAGPCLVCNFLDLPGRDQVAFIIPKRCGPAVVRNRIRRRLKEAFRQCRHRIQPDKLIIWISRAPAAKASYAELEAEVHQLLDKSGLWQPKE